VFILSKDRTRRLLSQESILNEYGSPAKTSNAFVRKGQIVIRKDILIWRECHLCGSISQTQYQNYTSKPDRACLSCVKICERNPQYGKSGPWLGKSMPREAVKKMVISRIKNDSYSHSNETRSKMSANRRGENNPNYGHRWTEDMKKAASERVIGWYLSGKYPSKTNTGPEIEMAKILNRHGIKYEQQYVVTNKIFDFFIQTINTLVEVDGIYWHGKGLFYYEKTDTQKHNETNDRVKDQIAQQNGFSIRRVWGG